MQTLHQTSTVPINQCRLHCWVEIAMSFPATPETVLHLEYLLVSVPDVPAVAVAVVVAVLWE